MLDLSCLTSEQNVVGSDDVNTNELRRMITEAKQYLQSFEWCPHIQQAYLGLGISGVLVVVLVEFETPIADKDKFLWVVFGDLPSAYFVIDQSPDPVAALECYCALMQEWIHSVRGSGNPSNVFPVKAPRDEEHARMLQNRIAFIRERIIPEYR